MARIRKFHPPKSVIFITSSLEQGLLMKANPLIKSILESCLAKAQNLYPVRICHYLFEENHLHMIVVVENPEDVSDFMERFKTESALALNRLIGRERGKVWCDGYDSPVLLNPADVMKYITYLYCNPAKDGLTDSIEEYPNLNSWKAYRSGKYEINCLPIKRPDVPTLSSLRPSSREIDRYSEILLGRYPDRVKFVIEPDAWMEIMRVPENKRERVNVKIQEMVLKRENKYRQEREISGSKVVGREKLIYSSINLKFSSRRNGKRTYCISTQKTLRVKVIQYIKVLIEKGKKVLEEWRQGNTSLRFPVGLCPPSMPRMANLMPGVVV